MLPTTNESEQKRAYAEAMLRERDPWKAAVAVIGTADMGRCLYIKDHWPHDAEVQAHQSELVEANGIAAYLPQQNLFAQEVLDFSRCIMDAETRLKGYKLYAELMRMLDKGPSVVVDNRKVMIVKDHGTDDDWEAQLESQQRELMANATS